MVETGQFPSWPRMEMRRPCVSSSQMLSTGTGLAVGQDHGITDKLSLGLLEFAENRARAFLRDWHDGRSTNRED